MKFLGKIVKRVLVLMFSPLIMPLVIFDTLQAFLDGLNGDPRKVRFYE